VEKIEQQPSDEGSECAAPTPTAVSSEELPHEHLPSRWRAELHLRFARTNERTQLVERRHSGPLRLLKPLYPEGDANCHAVIVHPPGGIVAGDELLIAAHVEPNSHGVVTTPGAQKWYRSSAEGARSTTTLTIDNEATLEWLPQESMVFDGARAQQDLNIRLHARSRLFAWEIVCFGRTMRGEKFTRGQFRQRIAIVRDSVLLWQERTVIVGGDALLDSPIGFGGHTVSATAWIATGCDHVNEARDQAITDAIRAELSAHTLAAASNPAPGFFVVKTLGDDAESVRELLIRVWSQIRFEASGLRAHRPRIWST
jgi:urease accessory protein